METGSSSPLSNSGGKPLMPAAVPDEQFGLGLQLTASTPGSAVPSYGVPSAEQVPTAEEAGQERQPPPSARTSWGQDGAPAAPTGRPCLGNLAQALIFLAGALLAGGCYLYLQLMHAQTGETLKIRGASLGCAIVAVTLVGCSGSRFIRLSPLADDTRGARRRANARQEARRRRKIAKFPVRVVSRRGVSAPEDLEIDAGGSFLSEGGEIQGGDAQKACPVCLEDYCKGDERRTLPCFHAFHLKCIDKWLESNDVCPVCRHNVFDLNLSSILDASLTSNVDSSPPSMTSNAEQ